MKSMMEWTLVLLVLVGLNGTAFAGSSDDYKVIKKSAKENTATSMEEVKWFKIEVRDMETDKIKVKVTIPISLVEVVSNWCPEGKMHIENDMEIDLKQMVQELKKIGPMAFIEVYEDNETVKIWVE